MSRIHRSLPPSGTAIGIAYSGGLDTRTAVAWLTRHGLDVHAYTADLGQPDETNVADIPGGAIKHGAKGARLVDCREAMAREGIVAIQCGAFHLGCGGRKYFNTTPLGRAVTTTAIVRAMKEDGVSVFSDGSTHKGNDIQRFYRYGVLVNPALRIYKPWLDTKFVTELGGRTEMSNYLESVGLPYTMKAEKAYSTDANVLGATHEAKDLERLDVSMKIVEPIMGVRPWDASATIAPETVRVRFEKGVPVALNGKRYTSLFELVVAANAIGGRHGFGMSDQIENRVIDAKSRGIYEAPAMALLHLTYERLLSSVHNENTTDLYLTLGRKLGRLLYEGRWFDPEAMVIKDALTRNVASVITGDVEVELRRGDDYTIVSTAAEGSAYEPDKLSMERTASAFTPEDRIGALEIQGISVLDNRALLLRRGASVGDGVGHRLDEILTDKGLMPAAAAIETDLPARLDRLPWSAWHRRVILALGITWMLDGLEVTLVGALGGALEDPHALGLSSAQVGLAGSVYVVGAMAGALIFGALTDRLGRKRLFLVTLAVYLVATALTATSWSFASFAFWRFFTGAGIGGEYAAMNSAIDELVPARLRGAIDLGINGTFWVGTAGGAALSLLLLDPHLLPPWLGWRLGFGLGAVLGGAILLVRRHLPESPRWLLTRGRTAEAETIVMGIEAEVYGSRAASLSATTGELPRVPIHPHRAVGVRRALRTLFVDYRARSVVSLVLMLAQAFFYNAIFFTYALVLTHFYEVPRNDVGLYLLPFAVGNFLGPLILGHFFDSFGRRRMIAVTYVASGLLLALVAVLFRQGVLTATSQTALWCLVFFRLSSREQCVPDGERSIPLEIRAFAIAVFYALGTGAGGALGPALFGALIQTNSRREVFAGYLLGAGLMIAAGFVALRFGVDAERRGLEAIAPPLHHDS